MSSLTWQDLGPLERAALRSLAFADVRGVAADTATVRRWMPGYEAPERNVALALREGPLRRWVQRGHGVWTLRDRAELSARQAPEQALLRARWGRERHRLAELGRTPGLVTLAVIGGATWGRLPQDEPLALLAVGEPAALAALRARLALWRRWDAAAPALITALLPDQPPEDRGLASALQLLEARPLVGADPLARLQAGADWARRAFPSGLLEPSAALAPLEPAPSRGGPRVRGRLWRRVAGWLDVEASAGELVGDLDLLESWKRRCAEVEAWQFENTPTPADAPPELLRVSPASPVVGRRPRRRRPRRQ